MVADLVNGVCVVTGAPKRTKQNRRSVAVNFGQAMTQFFQLLPRERSYGAFCFLDALKPICRPFDHVLTEEGYRSPRFYLTATVTELWDWVPPTAIVTG